jgi:hypothetical protein
VVVEKIQLKKEMKKSSSSTILNSSVICTAAQTSRKITELADLLGRWWNWFVSSIWKYAKKEHLEFRKMSRDYDYE